MSQLDFYNTLPCDVSIKGPFINDTVIESTNRFKLGEYPTFIEAKEYHIIATQVLSSTDGKCGDWPISSTDWNGTISAGSNNVRSRSKSVHSDLFKVISAFSFRHTRF